MACEYGLRGIPPLYPGDLLGFLLGWGVSCLFSSLLLEDSGSWRNW